MFLTIITMRTSFTWKISLFCFLLGQPIHLNRCLSPITSWALSPTVLCVLHSSVSQISVPHHSNHFYLFRQLPVLYFLYPLASLSEDILQATRHDGYMKPLGLRGSLSLNARRKGVPTGYRHLVRCRSQRHLVGHSEI